MQNLEIILLFIISAGLGGLIGIQIERNVKRSFLPGIRTHIIVTVLGTLSYLLYHQLNLEYIVYIIFFSIILFIITQNKIKTQKQANRVFENSLLYELLIVVSFVNGILVATNSIYIAMFITFIISILLYTTPQLHKFSHSLTKEEIHSSLLFISISAIILPLLPNTSINLSSIEFLQTTLPQSILLALESVTSLNLFIIWSLVVIISGLSFCSYIAMKLLGEKKGIFLTGILGGFVSSTALTTSFSIFSKQNKHLNLFFAGGIVTASSIMLIRILFEIIIISPKLALYLALPFSLTALIGIGSIYVFSKLKKGPHSTIPLKHQTTLKSPFRIAPALFFGFVFTIVIILSSMSLYFFSNTGLYLTAIISGLVDADAITLTVSQLYKNNQISEYVAIIAISLGVFSNTFVKLIIAYLFGGIELLKTVSIYFFIILVSYITLITTMILFFF
ncbi:MAG: MgtC/SapB family protein [Candidatus Nanoarchaeia archaeon]